MQTFSLTLIIIIVTNLFGFAQTALSKLVEGGKLLIALVKMFKKPPSQQSLQGKETNSSDLCFTNSTTDNLFIEFSKKLALQLTKSYRCYQPGS